MRDRRITKRLVDSLKSTGDDSFVWDDTLIGFGVRVQPTGVKSYVVKYRAGSGRGAPTRRVTLGKVGILTPDEARALGRPWQRPRGGQSCGTSCVNLARTS
jgi:Arm DNA-binding domain